MQEKIQSEAGLRVCLKGNNVLMKTSKRIHYILEGPSGERKRLNMLN